MSQAVTRLTNQYRTPFVVAAGNSGPGDQTVESPGVATDALTVGAVDAEDELADFGYFRYPQTAAEPVTKPLLLQNLGDAATTVDLRLELETEEGGGPAPAGMAMLSPSRLTLAAGGQATAQVTVDVGAGPPGLYSGAVVATPATGPAVRTPLGFNKEPERYDLTIKAIGRDGQPAALADAGF